MSASTISRIERGHPGSLSLDTIRRIAAALDVRVELVGRWRAGDLDRLLNSRHSALHEAVARQFHDQLPAWVLAPEVSFSIYGERGVIDILAWHPGRRALLVIELKTDIADVNEMIGTLDRKRRLAQQVAQQRGWDPATVSVWLIVAEGRTNRARIAAHRNILANAFPTQAKRIREWLRDPIGSLAGITTWSQGWNAPAPSRVRRVRASG